MLLFTNTMTKVFAIYHQWCNLISNRSMDLSHIIIENRLELFLFYSNKKKKKSLHNCLNEVFFSEVFSSNIVFLIFVDVK